jgi:hypothetical protein
LSGNAQADEVKAAETGSSTQSWLAGRSFGQLCKLGLALTWPLAIVALVALGLLVTVVLQHWNWH